MRESQGRWKVPIVTAQPVHEEPGSDDPLEILRVLPGEHHEQFRSEYSAAVEQARDPGSYRALADLLRLWRLRSAAYSDPGFGDRLGDARPGDASTEVPAGQVVAGWPRQ